MLCINKRLYRSCRSHGSHRPHRHSGGGRMFSAYSTPPASGSNNNPLEFDQNAESVGTGITHTAGSSDFTVTARDCIRQHFIPMRLRLPASISR